MLVVVVAVELVAVCCLVGAPAAQDGRAVVAMAQVGKCVKLMAPFPEKVAVPLWHAPLVVADEYQHRRVGPARRSCAAVCQRKLVAVLLLTVIACPLVVVALVADAMPPHAPKVAVAMASPLVAVVGAAPLGRVMRRLAVTVVRLRVVLAARRP